KAQPGDSGPAPEVGAAELAGANGNPATLIALAATPAPPSPVVPPQGNLAARVSISPEGKKPGVPGGSPKGTPGATGGTRGGSGNPAPNTNGIDIRIRGGNTPAK